MVLYPLHNWARGLHSLAKPFPIEVHPVGWNQVAQRNNKRKRCRVGQITGGQYMLYVTSWAEKAIFSKGMENTLSYLFILSS